MLNFSTGSAMVLAQYYNFVRFGFEGYRYIMETMQANTRALAQRIAGIGEFRLIGHDSVEQLPLVAFQHTLPPNADHVTIMRALVKLTLGGTRSPPPSPTTSHRPARRCATRAACTSATAAGSRPEPAIEPHGRQSRLRRP